MVVTGGIANNNVNIKMERSTFVKYPVIVAICCFMSACSNNPKKPALGAAVAAPVKAIVQAPAEIVNTPRGPSLTVNNVLFDFEQSSLRAEADSTVEKAAAYLRNNPERTALIEGHTDHIGAEQYNHGLSLQRSESVKNALIDQGISVSRIKTVGLGETKPVADNASATGRQANRRVEIIFGIAQ